MFKLPWMKVHNVQTTRATTSIGVMEGSKRLAKKLAQQFKH
jgi:hypothetical protein